MNKDRILELADAIEQHSISDLGFNMIDYIIEGVADRSGHNCGTTACLAGWAVHLANGVDSSFDRYDTVEYGNQIVCAGTYADEIATEWLGLSETEAEQLFLMTDGYWHDTDISMDDVTATQAVACLRNLAETGVVDWDKVLLPANNGQPQT